MSNYFVNQFFNQDCIVGAQQRLPDNCVDFVFCDPPFGVKGDSFGSQYNRNASLVTGGYVEVAANDYQEFSMQWIRQVARVLKPGCLLCVVSGYSQLQAVLEALDAPQHCLQFRQHLIWRFNFGVYTTRKFVSSHYHILFYEKKTIVQESEHSFVDNNDKDSVLMINRQNRSGQVRNQNQLPDQLVYQLIHIGLSKQRQQRQQQTTEPLLVADFFLGSFATARAAIALGLNATGFELNREAFDHWNLETQKLINEKEQPLQPRELLWPIISAPIVAKTFAMPVLPGNATTTNIDLVICWPLQLPDSNWFKSVGESMRIGASLYLVVQSRDLKLALRLLHSERQLTEVNHIIWRFALNTSFSFPTSTTTVDTTTTTTTNESNHLHILFWQKGTGVAAKNRTFNTYAVHAASVKRLRDSSGGGSSANYSDREDVWWQRDEEPPRALMWQEVVRKAIRYSSNINDRVASFCNDSCNVVRTEVSILHRTYCQ